MSIPTQPRPPTRQEWTDWKWQQRNTVRSARHLKEHFPKCDQDLLDRVDQHTKTFRFQATPYFLHLIDTDPATGNPVRDDPLWRQVVPPEITSSHDAFDYDGETENWELDSEMVTPIAQHKYDNRVIVRYANVCHAYCQFCYEALRTLDKDSAKVAFDLGHWAVTLDYLRANPAIEEVILSGGEPLMHSDDQLDRLMGDIRAARPDIIVRIHTRALTFNPFRICPDLVDILKRHQVTCVGLHITSPRELTPDFDAALRQLQTAVPIVFANVPLLAGVNDDLDRLRTLCMGLYRRGVHAGYLYHFMPHSPGSASFRVPIRRGVELMQALRRHISNPAVPEYVLPHATGKYTVPLYLSPEELPRHVSGAGGLRVLEFVNWQGDRVQYPDPDTDSH
jgi:lysine 2,3-aminomutase